jgi:hypothetical protein
LFLLGGLPWNLRNLAAGGVSSLIAVNMSARGVKHAIVVLRCRSSCWFLLGGLPWNVRGEGDSRRRSEHGATGAKHAVVMTPAALCAM